MYVLIIIRLNPNKSLVSSQKVFIYVHTIKKKFLTIFFMTLMAWKIVLTIYSMGGGGEVEATKMPVYIFFNLRFKIYVPVVKLFNFNLI